MEAIVTALRDKAMNVRVEACIALGNLEKGTSKSVIAQVHDINKATKM